MIDFVTSIKNALHLWRGKLVGATFTPGDTGYGSVNVEVSQKSIEGDKAFTVPIMQPYGMVSVPVDTLNGVGCYLTGTTQNPIVLGIVPVILDDDPRVGVLAVGETTIYSMHYGVRVLNSGLKYATQNTSGEYTSNVVNGDWVSQITADLIEQFKVLFEQTFISISTKFNTHTHPAPGGATGTPTTFFDFGQIESDLTSDLNAINSNKIFIADSGTAP